jgi:starvation-inducible DNA-binding protein
MISREELEAAGRAYGRQRYDLADDTALIAALHALLADVFGLYFIAHASHWNVTGPLFPELHEFFGELYADVFSAVDPLAEAIRQHDAFAPTDVAAMGGQIKAPPATGDPAPLLAALVAANTQVMDDYKATKDAAEAADDLGLANFCQDRLAAHLKHDWQLRAQTGRAA